MEPAWRLALSVWWQQDPHRRHKAGKLVPDEQRTRPVQRPRFASLIAEQFSAPAEGRC